MFIPENDPETQSTNRHMICGMPRKLSGEYGQAIIDMSDLMFEIINMARDSPEVMVKTVENLLVQMQQSALFARRLELMEDFGISETYLSDVMRGLREKVRTDP